VAISLAQVGGGSYSTASQTSWSFFSVTNSMANSNGLFGAYGVQSYNGYTLISFPNPLVNPTTQQWNAATNRYTCQQGGIFFFSFSVGVLANQVAQLSLDGLDQLFLAERLTTSNNGLTTLSRTVLAPCGSSTSVGLVNFNGGISPGSNTNLISFTVFPYSLNTGYSVAWAGYRSTSSNSAADPLTYDQWLVSQNVSPSGAATITIPTTGYYYVYISSGVQANQKINMQLKRNNVVVFALTRQSTNHNAVDTIGHGIVILLNQNDVIKVTVDSNTGLYSNMAGLHTSFLGFLIYSGV
jgi:hypothetical protein